MTLKEIGYFLFALLGILVVIGVGFIILDDLKYNTENCIYIDTDECAQIKYINGTCFIIGNTMCNMIDSQIMGLGPIPLGVLIVLIVAIMLFLFCSITIKH